MSNYEYSSYSSSSSTAGTGTAATGGFDVAKAIFNQVDTNRDGTIDRNEFQQWIGAATQSSGEAGASYESASYESSNLGSSETAYGVDTGFATVGGASTFESSGTVADGAGSVVVGDNIHSSSTFESSTSAGNFEVAAVSQAAAYTADSNAAWSKYGAEVRGAGLYVDTNPQIIRRAAAGGVQTYTQNIKVRFLQPPPVPPPGPLIIKEVRPPQPPPPPPLRIRQQAPPLPQPPPLVLRERPPPMPTVQAAQTVIRKLPVLPVPPRSVIIERIPAAPPRPRDIIIERWVPYGPAEKRKTIVQRAEAAKPYPAPRNIIIQYEPVQVRVVRQFQRLSVTQENPQAYLQRYGAQLLDAQNLVQQARAAGVVEDISPPAASVNVSATSFNQESSSFGVGGVELAGAVSSGFAGTSSFSSSTYENGSVDAGNAATAGVGFESGLVENAGGAFASSSFESSSFSTAVDGGVADAANVDYSSAAYSSVGGVAGFDVAAAAFNSIDKNKDGTVDAEEFRQFYQGGL